MAEDKEKIVIQFDTNADKASKDIDKLTASLNVTESTASNLNATFDEVYGGLKPLTTRMGEAEDRLYELALAGKTAGQEYKDLLAIVGNYRKTQIETDRVVDAAATTLGQKLGGAAQIAATGVQGVTAGMALFGDQSEDTEKALLKVQAAMAFADAISNVSELSGQFTILKASVLESSIVTKANSAATGLAAIVQKLFTGSVNTTSTSFKVLKGAIAATGIGLLVVGVTALIQNFDTVKKVVFDLVPGLRGVGNAIGNIVNAVTDFVGITSEADRAIDRIKSNADQSISLNKKFLAEHGSQLNEFTKQKISAKDKYNEAVKEDGADITALGKELNRELAKIEYSRGDEQRAIQKTNSEKAAADAITNAKKATEDAIKAEEDAVKKREDKRKAAEEKAIADFQEEQNIAAELTKIGDDKQLKKEEKLIKNGENEAAILKANFAEEKIIRDEQLKQQQERDKVLATSKAFLLNIISSLESSGLTKTKAGLAISKSIALAQIGIDSAVAISKASTLANAEGAAAQLAFPLVPGIGTVARVVSYAGTAASVISNIARAKQLLNSGGSGGGGGGGTGGGGFASAGASSPRGATSPAPQTGFQSSNNNQIATSISANTNAQPVIKAYVVAQDLTDQQKKDTNLVSQNSFGGIIQG